MLKKEEVHFKKFSELLVQYRVRPTILDPRVWEKGAFGLGLLSAALGKKATMACTEAVEEVIINHYQKQASYLKGKDKSLEKLPESLLMMKRNICIKQKTMIQVTIFFTKFLN